MPTLDISPEKVAWVIVRWRGLGSAAAMSAAGSDPARKELAGFIDALNDEEKVSLVALGWLGRGTYLMDEWDRALKMARRNKLNAAADYLLGNPLLAEQLESGLDAFGYPMGELEARVA
jgi:hypothetical protein